MPYTYNYYRKTLLSYTLFFILNFSFFFSLSSCSNCSKEEKEKSSVFDRITEEKLAQHQPATKFEMNGSSDAFKIRPRKEIIISAEEGAFDYNPHIVVNDLSAATLKELDDQISKETGSQLLFAYDIDAGLPHEYVLPGSYTVKVDLRQKGVPKILWNHICVYRSGEGNVLQRLNIQVKNGVLTYVATQNSVVSFCCESPFFIAMLGLPYVAYKAGQPGIDNQLEAIWEGTGWPENWWKYKDWVNLFIRDKNGDFYIHFRYSKTEWGDKAKDMVDNMEQLNALMGQHYNNALTTYLKKHPNSAKTWNDDNPNALARYRMGVDSIYYENIKKDERIKALEMTVPPSIQDIIKGMRLSERFARSKDGLQLQALPYVYDVYVVDSRHAGKESKAISQSIPLYGTYIAINYDHIYTKNGEKFIYDKNESDKVLISMGHELSHLYEYSYLVQPLVRDNRFIEALGALSEHWFARWLKKHGYISIDPDSKEAVEALGYANQTFKDLYAWPLGKEWPKNILGIGDVNTEGGYMLGTFVQYLCDNVPEGDKVTFDHMMRNYSVNKGFYQDMIDIFGIKHQGEFAKYFEGYCRKYMKEIVTRQKSHMASLKIKDSPNAKNVLFPTQFHKHYTCVKRFDKLGFNGTLKGEPFTIRTMKLFAIKDSAEKTIPYTVFAVPSEKVKPNEVYFTLLEGEDYKPANDKFFIDPWKTAKEASGRVETYGIVITRPGAANAVFDDNYYIDLVAFYQPYYGPTVRGRSKDGSGLNIDTGPEPTYNLLSHGYVSGMQIAVVNHKTGKSKTFNVPLSLSGKIVKLEFEKMGISDPDEIDISIRSRWYFKHPNGKTYYSPATERVNYKKKKEQVVQKKEEKEEDKDDFSGNDETVDEDAGEINKTVLLNIERINWTHGIQVGYKEWKLNEVRAHLVVKGGKFMLDVPAHHVEWKQEGKVEYTYIIDFPAYTVTGEVKLKPWGRDSADNPDKRYEVTRSTTTITPSKIKIIYKENELFHYNGELNVKTVTYDISPSGAVDDAYTLCQYAGGKKKWENLEILIPIKVKALKVNDYSEGIHKEEQFEDNDITMVIAATIE